jgi:hypothetical protein
MIGRFHPEGSEKWNHRWTVCYKSFVHESCLISIWCNLRRCLRKQWHHSTFQPRSGTGIKTFLVRALLLRLEIWSYWSQFLVIFRFLVHSASYGVNHFHLTRFESNAFSNSSLKSNTIPRCVRILCSSYFAGWRRLSSTSFETGSELTHIKSNTFSDCSRKSITFPQNVDFIDGRRLKLFLTSSCF